MKYQSELIKEIVEVRGHKQSSLHYESECIETWIEEAKGAYPKLCDYESEWLNYISVLDDTGGEDHEPPIGEFPYETLTDVTEATVDNVVPYAYKSAILKGQTKIMDELGNECESPNIPGVTMGGYIDGTNGKEVESTTSFNTTFLKCPSVTFIIKGNNRYKRIVFYDKNKSFISSIDPKISNNSNVTVNSSNIPANAAYIRMSASISTSGISYTPDTKLLIEDVSGNNLYITHLESVKIPVLTTSNGDGTKTNILTVNEDVTLCGIGDVKDELDCLTGEVTERIGEVVLNGSEKWSGPFSAGATVEGMYYYVYDNTSIKRNKTLNVLTTISCGGFVSIPYNSVWKLTQEGISSSNSTSLGLRLATKIASVTELKSYLQQNPTTVQYQLETESIKTVELSIQDQNGKTLSVIKPIEGKMHLSTSGDTIKPLFSGEIPVEAITQNLASFIDLETEE